MIIALQTLVFFRQSLLTAIDRILSPYYKRLSFTFSKYCPEDEEEEDEVFAEFDEEKGVVFFPPVYVQRYAAVSDCLIDERWCGKLEKVVDLGYHDMSFIKYLKEVPGVRHILGVDIESIPLRCSSDLLGCDDYAPKRENPLQVTLFQGNAADPDYRLIGCDAVVAIEMIEHMLPHDLDRLVHTIFGFIKPWIAIITTPNSDFNVLFKALEKNGLRRLDHFFEWSREQFHDWCSNIVTRYPQFTVACRGIGPGPPDTQHYGCCSQLALFINKNYVKQQELHPNSLAIVSNVPSPYDVSEMVAGWESPINESANNMLVPQENDQSLTDFLYSSKQSCVTILIASSHTFSFTNVEYSDKMLQCNLDNEIGKNFLMFDDEDMCFSVRKPRKKTPGRVYEIGDVFSRLNCTTFQVTKFSKATQNLMAKNRLDSLVHTREVVSEIRHLTKMLNINRDTPAKDGGPHIWDNINWGDNAPYWNQYFKIVREYNYPFEMKSDEIRIVELISDEINRLIDAKCEEEFSTEINKLEIPLGHLMMVVQHITDDVDKVKDLLAWNGYELSGDMVIHSRMVVDTSVASCDGDWPENETVSDFDTTDVHSTTLSDGSTIIPDYHGRCLRRALDKKMHALRTMMSADEDVTTELDRVVCRLMKLALRTSYGKQTPPPTRWMQCKLLDLLTLTEKAISRRRRQYIESFPLKAIGDGHEQTEKSIILDKIKQENNTTDSLVSKYNHLVEALENRQLFDPFTFGFEDEMGDQDSGEYLRGFDTTDVPYTPQPETVAATVNNTENKIKKPPWFVEDNFETVSHPEHSAKSPMMLSDYSTSNGEWKKFKKPRPKTEPKPGDRKAHKRTFSKVTNEKPKLDDKNRSKKVKTTVVKKPLRNTSTSFTTIAKVHSKKLADDANYTLKSKRSKKDHKKITSCHFAVCPPKTTQNNGKEIAYLATEKNDNDIKATPDSQVAATEESNLVEIIMDDKEETIALRRSIGTDADVHSPTFEEELVIGNLTNVTKDDSSHNKLQVTSEFSQTIFLYDINEPSTSKGVRHISMDVQCGTDMVTPAYGLLTPPASVTRMPNIFNNGVKIGDSLTNMLSKRNSFDFGSPTNNIQNFGPVCSRLRAPFFSKGIRIEDSLDNLAARKNSRDFGTTCNTDIDDERLCKSPTRTKIRIKDSLSEVRARKSSDFGTSTNENILKHEIIRELSPRGRSSISRSIGIKIKDSTTELRPIKNISIGTETNENLEIPKYEYPYIFSAERNDNSYPSRLRGTSPNSRQNESHRNEGLGNMSNDSGSYRTHNISVGMTKCYEKDPESRSPTIFMEDNTHNSDFGTSTSEVSESCRVVSPRVKSPVVFRNKFQSFDCATTTDDFTNIFASNNKENSPAAEFCDNSTLNYKYYNFGIPEKDDTNISSTTFRKNEVTCNEQAEVCKGPPGLKRNGCKVKSPNTNIIKKVEFATTRVKLLSSCHPYQPTERFRSPPSEKTEYTRPVSSPMKTEDSSSDFYGTNYCSSQKSFLHVTNSFSNTSEGSRGTKRRESISPTKSMGRRLSCGGIHVHSYKEKERSEDIVFQGEWQRQSPKATKKLPAKVIPKLKAKKTNVRKINSKENVPLKKIERTYEVKHEPKKPMHVRNTKSIKTKQELINKTEQLRKVTLPNIAKAIKANNKNIAKVSSKIGMNSITSKNSRNARSVKRPINVVQTSVKRDSDVIDSEKRNDILKKSYLPPYLKRKKLFLEHKNNLNQSIDSVQTTILSKNILDDDPFRTNAIDIKRDLVKVQDEPRDVVNYAVFRNELDNCNQAESSENSNLPGNVSRKKNLPKRSSSPMSPNSSTCSTSQSIATVRTMSTWSKGSRLNSTSSNKSSIGFTDSETTAPSKVRKFSKKKIIQKKVDDDDKENVPESSRKVRLDKGFFNIRNAFKNRKSVFVTQFSTDSGLALNTKTPNKSNVKIPAIESTEDVKRPKSAGVSKKKSMQSDDSSHTAEIKKQESLSSELSDKVLLLEPQKPVQDAISPPTSLNEPIIKVVDSGLLTEWLESGNMSAVQRQSTENAILAAMRQIVEERLSLVAGLANDTVISESALISSEESRELDDSSSLKSFKTVVHMTDKDFDERMEAEIENLNNTIECLNLGNETGNELDYLSFKSVTSTSRYSEYFSADNDQTMNETPTVNSVRDIFERKDMNVMPHQVGPLAIQAFSGFSMNTEPVVGDQADYVNLIDSETGSVALDMARLATSEEVFVSGRSSESYESCVIDEDAVVPNWLFHIISQQQSVEEENAQELIPLPMPLDEPGFDLNGNVLEPGMGMGAGAGDGRGIHSNHSQDSSGRGSTLSSTDTSSGQQSEIQAILIDPSASTAQFDLVHEPISSSVAVTTLVVPVDHPQGNNELSTSHDHSRMVPRLLVLTSDGDADVSSIDTDFPDSSDN